MEKEQKDVSELVKMYSNWGILCYFVPLSVCKTGMGSQAELVDSSASEKLYSIAIQKFQKADLLAS